MKFNSQIAFGGGLPVFDEQTIKTEPMLHRADRSFTRAKGGPLTHAFLTSLEQCAGWGPEIPILIDSRVHMLMPGMYPCIPGWHHDDVPREREDKQPNYVNPSYKSQHCMALWGNCSLTHFAIGEHELEIPPIGQKIYKTWSPVVEQMVKDHKLRTAVAPEHRLIFFDWETWHRGAETTKTGFRFFIRATRKSNLAARNEIRYNANVYMPVLDEGW